MEDIMAKAKKAQAGKAASRRKARKKLVASAKIIRAARKSAARAAKGSPIRKAVRTKTAKRSGGDRLVLYGLHLSLPSCKVGLMLGLCGAQFDYKHVNLGAGEHKTPEFLAKSRFGQVPVLQDGDAFICQSNVILQYLADKFGKFGGRTPAEKLRIAEWLAWDLDRMAGGVGLTRGLTRFMQQDPAVVNFTRARGEQALAQLDRHLGTSKFLAGSQPSIADVAIFPWVATAEEGGFDIVRWPNVRAWAERVLNLSGAAHPYAMMPKEDRVAT
jgi:glutathione S-transferase